MVLFFFPLILGLLNIIYSTGCKNHKVFNINLKAENALLCFNKSIIEKEFYKEDLICLFHLLQRDPNTTLDNIMDIINIQIQV